MAEEMANTGDYHWFFRGACGSLGELRNEDLNDAIRDLIIRLDIDDCDPLVIFLNYHPVMECRLAHAVKGFDEDQGLEFDTRVVNVMSITSNLCDVKVITLTR